MLYIIKGKEPDSLIKYRKNTFAYFDGYKEKDDIRQKLLEEQGYLCAYCMRRIDSRHMKIEHWYPENRLTDAQMLDYSNMLGACMGHIDGTKSADDTCDTHKKDTVITVNPQDKTTLGKIQYRSATGEIYSKDEKIQTDLNDVLNLNSKKHLLMENRKAKLDSVISEMARLQKKGSWNYKMLSSMKAQYENRDSNGKKKEYAGIVLWYLDKKIKRADHL